VADRLKQCLPVDCLNHILAAEGEDWFDVMLRRMWQHSFYLFCIVF